LELQVSEDLLMGQVLPGRAGSIAVDGPQGTVAQAQADDSGFFQLPRPPAGTIRLRLEGPPGLVTDWLSL
jgi:hypothetical protein